MAFLRQSIRQFAVLTFLLLRLLTAQAEGITASADPSTYQRSDRGANLTDSYIKTFARAPRLNKSQLTSYKIVIVPGLLATRVEKFWGYFTQTRAALNNMGLAEGKDFVILDGTVGFLGEQSIELNKVAIAREILAADRPVLLLTHSKGSVDSLETLVAHPELRNRVKGWFSIQGPIWGSPISDACELNRWNGIAVSLLLQFHGGSASAVSELTTAKRFAFNKIHLHEIESLSREFPIISFASWKPFDARFWLFRAIDRMSFVSPERGRFDGMVDANDAIIPGSASILVGGIDHGDPVIGNDSDSLFDRARFTTTALELLLGQVQSER